MIGFGKFGHDLMDVLVQDLTQEEAFQINVVDIADRQSAVMTLAEELGVADRVSFVRAAIQDLNLEDDQDKAFFLCTDDDLGNLTGALRLAAKIDCNHIYVRMARWPLRAMADHLGEERGVRFINLNELVVKGLDGLPGIFEPAARADLQPRSPIQTVTHSQ